MQKVLNKKEIKELNEKYNYLNLNKKDKVIMYDDHYEANGNIILIIKDKEVVPSLHLIIENDIDIPYVFVDKGAIPFVIKGANIMRPGIKKLGEFSKGDVVIVRDIEHNKPIAIGRALYDSVEIDNMKNGKAIENLHYVGDRWW